MSYTPTNWKSGDVVTSAKLNKLEQGVASAGGVLIAHDSNGTLDKTWQEIYDAGFAVVYTQGGTASSFYTAFLTGAEIYEGEYDLYFVDLSDMSDPRRLMYVTDSADGYPEYQAESELPPGGGGSGGTPA